MDDMRFQEETFAVLGELAGTHHLAEIVSLGIVESMVLFLTHQPCRIVAQVGLSDLTD